MMPVRYVSRELLKREQAHSTEEKECLAVVWTVRQLYKYIYGREFTLQTDHLPLVCIGQKKVANERIMRWALMLQEQKMNIEAIRGVDNVVADFLSRL